MLRIPTSLVLKAILPAAEHRYLDYYYYFINLLYERQAYDRSLDDWVPLNARMLQKVMGRQQKRIKDTLIRLGIVEARNNGQYVVGDKSIQYRLTEQYQNERYRRVPPVKASVVRHLSAERKSRLMPKTKLQQKLAAWVIRLHIDREAAFRAIEYLEGRRWCLSRAAIENIAERRFYFSPDKYGRIHTNLTSLPRTLRPFLTVDGQPLWNIDIACSQPVFLYALISKQPAFKSISSNISSKYNTSFSSPYDTTLDDVALYYSLVCTGQLYEFIMQTAGITDRKVAKDAFFLFIYCKVTSRLTKVGRILKECFPTIYKICRELKSIDYRDLARTLQRTESAFVIDGVCGTLVRQYPHVPLFTIHDSIMTTEPFTHLVTAAFAEQSKSTGITPTIKADAPNVGRLAA